MRKLEEKLNRLDEECPLLPFTRSSQLYSAVRRMKAEQEMSIPLKYRSRFAISVKSGKAASEMKKAEWEEFYRTLKSNLKSDYPDIYASLFKNG